MKQVKCDNPSCSKLVEVSESDISQLKAICCSLSCVESWENQNGFIDSKKTRVIHKDYRKNTLQDVTLSRFNRV